MLWPNWKRVTYFSPFQILKIQSTVSIASKSKDSEKSRAAEEKAFNDAALPILKNIQEGHTAFYI